MPAFNLDLLRRLCEAPGISGREGAVREIVLAEFTPLVDERSIDAMGSVIGVKKGSGGPKVAVSTIWTRSVST